MEQSAFSQFPGSLQMNRGLPLLSPDSVSVMGKTLPDQLVFLYNFANQILLYSQQNGLDGSWQKMLAPDLSFILAAMQCSDPDVAAQQIKVLETDYQNQASIAEQQLAIVGLFQISLDLGEALAEWLARVRSLSRDELELETQLSNAIRNHCRLTLPSWKNSLYFLAQHFPSLPQNSFQNRSLDAASAAFEILESVLKPEDISHKVDEASWADYQKLYTYIRELLKGFLRAAYQAQKLGKDLFEASLQLPSHPPQTTLLIAFLSMLQQGEQSLNGLTAKRLNFYYQQVLQFGLLPASPDKVFVRFELNNNATGAYVPAGTKLPAGKGPSGAEILYQTDQDLFVNQIAVEQVKTVYNGGVLDKIPYRNKLYAAPVADSLDGKGTPFPAGKAKWAPLGSAPREGAPAAMETALTGFSLSDPILFLSEGLRTISVYIVVEAESFKGLRSKLESLAKPGEQLPTTFSRLLGQSFKAAYTGPKSWVDSLLSQELSFFAPDFPLASGPAQIQNASGFWFGLSLASGSPALQGADPAIHGPGYSAGQPLIRMELDQDAVSWQEVNLPAPSQSEYVAISPYNLLRGTKVSSIELEVSVSGQHTFSVQNDTSVLVAGQPYMPFGAEAQAGSHFYIGSQEVFRKQLTALRVTMEWDKLPTYTAGFSEYYKVWNDNWPEGAPKFNNAVFTMQPHILQAGEWVPVYRNPILPGDPKETDYPLFAWEPVLPEPAGSPPSPGAEQGAGNPPQGGQAGAGANPPQGATAGAGGNPDQALPPAPHHTGLGAHLLSFGGHLLNLVSKVGDLATPGGAIKLLLHSLGPHVSELPAHLPALVKHFPGLRPHLPKLIASIPELRSYLPALSQHFPELGVDGGAAAGAGGLPQAASDSSPGSPGGPPPVLAPANWLTLNLDASAVPPLILEAIGAPSQPDGKLLSSITWNRFDLSGLNAGAFRQQPALQSKTEWKPGSKSGFLRLTLSAPTTGFGFSRYQDVVSKVNEYNMRVILEKAGQGGSPDSGVAVMQAVPKPAFILRAKSLSVDYQASASLDFSQPPTTPGLYSLQPFGVTAAGISGGTAALLPDYDRQGYLFLGLSGLQPPAPLSLSFYVDPDTSIANQAISEQLEWSYLQNGNWIRFSDSVFLSDTTDNLVRSGILSFSLTMGPGPDGGWFNSVKNAGELFWIRATTPGQASAYCKVLALETQVCEAAYVVGPDATAHLKSPLPGGSITKLVTPIPNISKVEQAFPSSGGRPPETVAESYIRIHERLRHKDRGVAPWDLERLVLQAFPETGLVKAIGHASAQHVVHPGYTTLVLLPADFSGADKGSLTPMVSRSLLEQVQDYLKPLIPGNMMLQVRNPEYEYIRVRASIGFAPDADPGYYLDILQSGLCALITPWLSEPLVHNPFQQKLNRAMILEYLHAQPFVKSVGEDFAVYHYTVSQDKAHYIPDRGDYVDFETQKPWGIITSAAQHQLRDINGKPFAPDTNLIGLVVPDPEPPQAPVPVPAGASTEPLVEYLLIENLN